MNTIQALEHYYLKQPEPIQGCLLALKHIILNADSAISHQRKFQIPFFYYKDKKLAFLWVRRKQIILGFVEDKKIHPVVPGIKLKDQISSVIIDPNKDLPVEFIVENLARYIQLYNHSTPL